MTVLTKKTSTRKTTANLAVLNDSTNQEDVDGNVDILLSSTPLEVKNLPCVCGAGDKDLVVERTASMSTSATRSAPVEQLECHVDSVL